MKKVRSIFLGGTLELLAIMFAGNWFHVHALEGELQREADSKIAGFLEEREALTDEFKITSASVVSKDYVVAGQVRGKISVYMVSSHEEGDEHFEGFEFFYERNGPDDWNQTESGRCSSEECTTEGLKLLKALDEH